MNAGLTRQAFRRHPWSFLGPMSTQALGAAIIAGSLGTLTSIDRAPLSPAARQTLVETDVPDMALIFVMISVYLSIVIVGVTFGATIGRQARDIALVRAIGATPGRVRRAVALQAVLVAIPASLVGVPLGTLGGQAWLRGLVAHGVVPDAVTFHANAFAVPVALAITLGTSLIGALVAAIRPSRVRPAVALTESAAPKRRTGVVRTGLGITLVIGGIGLSIYIGHSVPDHAEELSFFTLLALCIGTGLLAPTLLRTVAPLARLLGPTGALAADNVVARSRAFSGALVPLILAAGFATIKVVMHTTAVHVSGVAESPAALWTDYSGTAVYTAFAAVAALNTFATVILARRRDLAVGRLAGATVGRMLAVLICEAVIVTGTGLVAAIGVATATMLPMVHAAFGTWSPWLPFSYAAVGVLGVTAVVLAGTAIPGALAMRRPAIETVEVDA
jgi:putative ABC transport system permease protein